MSNMDGYIGFVIFCAFCFSPIALFYVVKRLLRKVSAAMNGTLEQTAGKVAIGAAAGGVGIACFLGICFFLAMIVATVGAMASAL